MKFSSTFLTFLFATTVAGASPSGPRVLFRCDLKTPNSTTSITVKADLAGNIAGAEFISGQDTNRDTTEYTPDQVTKESMSSAEILKDEETVNLLKMYRVDVNSVKELKTFTLSLGSSASTTWLFDAVDKSGRSLLKGFAGQGSFPIICDK